MKTGDLTREADIDDMRRRLGGDADLVADLCRLFVELCPEQLRTLESAVTERDLEAVRRAAHLFKSSAANLSASKVTRDAALLEEMAEAGRVADLDRQLAALKLDVDRLVTELREVCARGEIANSDR